MASSLDRLREHTAALRSVETSARQLKAELERVRIELDPLVAGLRIVQRETGAIRKQRDEGRTARAVLVVLCGALGGAVGALIVLWTGR